MKIMTTTMKWIEISMAMIKLITEIMVKMRLTVMITQIVKNNYTQTTNQIHYPSSINIYCMLSAGFIDGVATQVSARRTSPVSDVSSLVSQ